MNGSRLVNRNVMAERGRTSIRLEPELWDALAEICRREAITSGELMRRIEAGRPHAGGRTSAVRVHLVEYFRAAATAAGHEAAGHGARPAPSRGPEPHGSLGRGGCGRTALPKAPQNAPQNAGQNAGRNAGQNGGQNAARPNIAVSSA